uniref:CCHC-type domain-containing protein n=1 Tax=Tanacetum cinerariifolium TaxID=118510 RepID=A0A6L2KGW6_TANCI|nr:hypothetical protein [Tanacetum cinerariifolium]
MVRIFNPKTLYDAYCLAYMNSKEDDKNKKCLSNYNGIVNGDDGSKEIKSLSFEEKYDGSTWSLLEEHDINIFEDEKKSGNVSTYAYDVRIFAKSILKHDNKLFQKGNWEDSEKMIILLTHVEFSGSEWLGKKKICGIYCQVKNNKWKFDIWRWPKRKKKTHYKFKLGSEVELMVADKELLKAQDTRFNLTAFADANHASCQDTRQSTSGSAQFLEESLTTGHPRNNSVLRSQQQRHNTPPCLTAMLKSNGCDHREESSQPPQPPIALTESPQMVLSVKLPILKKGEYILWTMKMEQSPPITAQQILARTRERKAKSTLLMAILDEYLARFHGIKDAKTLWAAIKTRFGGNSESKKMQKNVLKQQFEKKFISNSKGLDKGYDRFQRLLSLLEIHEAGVSTEDANKKFLRYLPSAWSNISLIMRNKPGIDNLDIDDLYNNLKVYEVDFKGSSGSSSNSQNVDFVFAKSTNSSNEVNAAYSVSTATGHSSQAQGSSSYADELMFSFFANQSSTLQLDKEDLEQINQDDLEEIDLKWQVAMLSMRVECFNCRRRRHFARDCRSARNSGNKSRDARNARYRGRDNGKRPTKEEDEQALVVQDGLGTHEWSYQVEEEAIDFALMVFTSNSSSSSSSNFEIQSCSKQCEQSYKQLKTLFDEQRKKLSKANIEIIGYQHGLESIEKQLRVHQQKEVIYEEKIRVLEYQVNDKSNLLKYTQKQLDEALKEREDLKAKLEKFETSLKNLTKLLDSQISAKVKTSLGYDSQFNEKKVLDIKEEEVTETVFDNHSSDEENSVANDRFKKGDGYHAIPHPLTRNYMPHKPDLSFAGLDDSIYKFKISERVTSLAKDEKDAPETNTVCVEKPKEDRMAKKSVLPTNVGNGTGHRESRPVWNNLQRINHQNKFAPIAVFTRSKAVSAVKGNRVTAVKTSAGNKAYLAEYQEIHDGGFVAFGSSRGKITSKVCDKKNSVLFSETECLVLSPNFMLFDESQVLFRVPRQSNMYSSDLQNVVPSGDLTCLFAKASIDESNLWHKRLGHVNIKTMNKLMKGNIVRERKNMTLIKAARTMLADSLLPVTFWAEAVNTACYVLNRALVTKTYNKTPYKLLNGRSHRLDFMRPFGCPVTILNTLDPLGNFEGKADEGFLVGYSVTRNQTDKNAGPQDTNGNAGTQDNVDAGKEVSDQHYIVLPLWSSIFSTYESLDGKPADDKPKDDTSSMTVREPVNKEDQAYRDELDRLMSQEKEASNAMDTLRKEFEQGCMDQRGVTQASSTNSFNTVSNPVNVASTSETFSAGGPSSPHPDAFIPANTLLHCYDDDLDIYTSPVQSMGAKADFNNMESSTIVSLIPTHKVHIDHPKDQILGDPKSAVQTRGMSKKSSRAHALMEPKKVSQALDVDLPYRKKAIGTKWVYRNKKDKRGIVVKNKARLVAQGHRYEEGIDYDEAFAPVARIKAIRIFLAFASFMRFIIYQIDVKSTFLYDKIEEEVYVSQPPGLIDPQFPNKVYKVEKALYGLHQAPRACYETLSTFLLQNGYRRGIINKNLFIKKEKDDIMLVQVFQMSSMSELTFFLGLQVKQSEKRIFICQDKYVAEILKKFDFSSVKTTSTPIETQKPLVKDEVAADVDVYLFRSMIGSLMYLMASRPDIMFAICACFRRLISWQCKKQTIVATSTTEDEYVVAAHYCGQVLWIQNQMLDYGFNFMNTKMYIDNESIICIVKNPVYHSKTKHIDIRHHFIRDSYEKKLIQVLKIHTDENVADLLTNAFDVSRFNFLKANIGMLNLQLH